MIEDNNCDDWLANGGSQAINDLAKVIQAIGIDSANPAEIAALTQCRLHDHPPLFI